MRIRQAAIAASFLLVGASPLHAREAGLEPGLQLAMSEAPDVLKWSKVAEGYFEGMGSDGSLVAAYYGVEGARLVVAKLERERIRTLADIEAIQSEIETGASSDAKLRLEKAKQRAAHLQHRIETAREVTSEQSIGAAKNIQSFDATTTGLCSLSNFGWAAFAATGVPGSTPAAQAYMDAWGSGGVTSPPPPAPPTAILRQVTAEVRVGSVYDSDYLWSYALDGDIVADAAMTSSTGACTLETWHGARAKCFVGDIWRYYSLYRETTCAAVAADSPPITHP